MPGARTNQETRERPTPPSDARASDSGGSRTRWWKHLAWPAWFALMFALRIGAASGSAGPRAATSGWLAATTALFAALDTLALFAAVRLTAQFPVGPERLVRHVSLHALAALTYAATNQALNAWIARRMSHALPPNDLGWWSHAILNIASYVLLAGLAHAAEYARRFRSSEAAGLIMHAELSEAARLRAEAELRTLKAELNPHFLANALQAVSGLIRFDPAAADRVLARLGDFMRASISRAATQEVTLEEEIDGLDPFLAIERARLGGQLTEEYDIGPEAFGALVPDMILQPLIEHALRICSVPQGGSGCVRISARRTGARRKMLELRVSVSVAVSGPSQASPISPSGVGLANARARLAELHGDAATLEITVASDGECAARLTLPWNDADAPRAAYGAASRQMSLAGSDITAAEVDAANRMLNDGATAVTLGQDNSGGISMNRRTATPWHHLSEFIGLPRTIIAVLVSWFAALWVGAAVVARDLPLGDGSVAPARSAVAEGLVTAILWTAVLYAALRVTRAHPVIAATPPAASNKWHALARHAVVALTLAVAASVAKVVFSWAVGYPFPPQLFVRLVATIIAFAVGYGVLAVVAHAAEYARRYQRTKAAGLTLRAELSEAARRRAEAELRALKAELNPHFLGNALHAVSGLMRTDLAAAERVLTQLGQLLQHATEGAGKQEVTLEEEIEGIQPFLAMERARFADQLAVSWDIEEAALNARVPHMILLPLLENAVKHGLSPRHGSGRIEVRARLTLDGLELVVRDDGVGLAATDRRRVAGSRGGVGLANARARLAELYGGAATLEIEPAPGGGVVARVMLPCELTEPLRMAAGGAESSTIPPVLASVPHS